MARAKASDLDNQDLIELAREIVAEAEQPEIEQPKSESPQSGREWTYPETARYQLTGQYPDWYTPNT